MASYKFPILIQKINTRTDVWDDYYSTHANINKVGGKEYEQASTNISNLVFNFKVRYCKELAEVMFKTSIYRIAYDNRYFDIKNIDRYGEGKTELTIVGEYNGEAYNS